jgi:hypothetical protein
MQVVQFVGFGQPPNVDDDVLFLRDVIAEMRAAPTEEFSEPGVKGPTSVHVPEVEGEPWGTFLIEWDASDVKLYQSARDAVIASIQQAIGQTDVKRLLMAADALPPLDPVLEDASRMAKRLENLISVYESKVLGRKKVPTLAIVVVGVAVLGLGAIAWSRRKRRRRRRR